MSIQTTLFASACIVALAVPPAAADDGGGDLDAVRRRGVLRHLGIPHTNFVTGSGDGFDVELVRGFAKRLGVRYEFVESDWPSALNDLAGRRVSPTSSDLRRAAPVPIRGDLIATGLVRLPWRERVVAFSEPYFWTQLWLVARADSALRPIRPGASPESDIRAVKALLAGRRLLGVPNTFLDPSLHRLEETGAKVVLRELAVDEVAPELIQGGSELALLAVGDAVVALQKWPGALKVIGPLSGRQEMGVAFRKDAPALRAVFDAFLADARRDGSYDRLVEAYFPEAPASFPELFRRAARDR